MWPPTVLVLLLIFREGSARQINGADGSTLDELQPLISQPLGRRDTGVEKRQTSLIRGLLGTRQNTCPEGNGYCTNSGRCCKTGGQCCEAGCCDAGHYCYSEGCCATNEMGCGENSCCPRGANCCGDGGCCRSDQYCLIIDGVRGCCQNGRTCTAPGTNPSACVDSGYTPCSNHNFCCPAGATCYVDEAGHNRCEGGSVNSTTTSTPMSSASREATTLITPDPTMTFNLTQLNTSDSSAPAGSQGTSGGNSIILLSRTCSLFCSCSLIIVFAYFSR